MVESELTNLQASVESLCKEAVAITDRAVKITHLTRIEREKLDSRNAALKQELEQLQADHKRLYAQVDHLVRTLREIRATANESLVTSTPSMKKIKLEATKTLTAVLGAESWSP